MCYTNPPEASNQTMLKHTELPSAFPNNSKTGEWVKNEEKEYDAIELADMLCKYNDYLSIIYSATEEALLSSSEGSAAKQEKEEKITSIAGESFPSQRLVLAILASEQRKIINWLLEKCHNNICESNSLLPSSFGTLPPPNDAMFFAMSSIDTPILCSN